LHSTLERVSVVPPLAAFEARAARFLADTRLIAATADYCGEMIAPDGGDWPTLKLFNQVGRYMVSFLLIYHYQAWRHHGGPPPTLGLLQSTRSLGPRQTASVVAGLRAGSLLSIERLQGQRARALAPLPALTGAIVRSPLAFLRAADALEDLPQSRASVFAADPGLQNELVYRSAAFVFAHGNLLDPHPCVQHFTTRDCGYLVLTAVIATAFAPPGCGPSLSCRDLARRFRVSRAHIGNLMAHAERERWLTTDGRGGLRSVDQGILESFRTWVASQMAHQAVLADAILAKERETCPMSRL